MKYTKEINIVEDNRAEWIFRFFAYALTGLQCSLYVVVVSLLIIGIEFLISLITPINAFYYSSKTSSTVYGHIFNSFLLVYVFVPTPLAWFFAYPFSLKRKKQTWGMKLIGLKLYHPDEAKIKWSTIIKREFTKFIGLIFVVGIFGLIWILFDKEERTLFDKISGTFVLKTKPTLKIIKEFRDYQYQKRLC